LPFINLLAISFSNAAAVNANRVGFWPVGFTFYAYEFAISGGMFLKAVWISLRRVLLGVAINLTLIVLAAYPLSKRSGKLFLRNIYMTFFFITMIINGGLIPTFILVSDLKLINTIWALILPGALPVFSVVILMNFIRGLPDELEDAALIDGASQFSVLLRIILPLMKPSLATVGLFSIVGHWNEWFSGLIYMQDPSNYPLQTYLQILLRRFEDIIRLAQGDYARIIAMMNVRSGRAAQLFMGAVPVMLIYPFLQKYFTTGLVLGSVKG
jgi:putative aldouronate transport system permease protein